MKNVSTWIDNAKVRKEIYDFNQAVKQVYSHYIYTEDGMAIPMMMKCIKSRPLMDKSFFTRTGECFPFIKNAAVDVELLNRALKEKCYVHSYEEESRANVLSQASVEEDKASYKVSYQLLPNQLEDIPNHPGLEMFTRYSQMTPIIRYKLSLENIARLINYEAIDILLGMHEGTEITLTMAKELVPMIKRTEDISILVYDQDELPPSTYGIMIVSVGPSWTFYSIHVILIDNGQG